mmetsp:Transcript_49768/g.73102  ORF Transcript_49768/g.73102 Transcript_49768/m.73102 type:complete len:212 (-) Transcript_49768:71-706(-)
MSAPTQGKCARGARSEGPWQRRRRLDILRSRSMVACRLRKRARSWQNLSGSMCADLRARCTRRAALSALKRSSVPRSTQFFTLVKCTCRMPAGGQVLQRTWPCERKRRAWSKRHCTTVPRRLGYPSAICSTTCVRVWRALAQARLTRNCSARKYGSKSRRLAERRKKLVCRSRPSKQASSATCVPSRTARPAAAAALARSSISTWLARTVR